MPIRQASDNGSEVAAFSAEIARQIPVLRSLAKALARNEEVAADLTQETLAKAWAARRTFAPGTNMKAWLVTIMRNQFRSDMRRAWRQVPWNQEAAERIPAPSDEQTWYIELGDAARAIGSLSRRQRDALILAGVGGHSSHDVGMITASRPTAVKSRVSRARQAARSMMDGTAPLKVKRTKRSCENINGLLTRFDQLTGNAA